VAGAVDAPAASAIRVDGQGGAVDDVTAAPVVAETRRALVVLAGIVGPATLVTALAYYFGWRREREFAGYFGIDPSVLGFSSSDYVLRSVDALFVPALVVLLVALGLVCLAMVSARLLNHPMTPAVIGLVAAVALAIGIAQLAGNPVWEGRFDLQALSLAVAGCLAVVALAQTRVDRRLLAVASSLAAAVVLISLFWATAEYASIRGRDQAERLARDLTVNPSVTIFSKQNLNIDPNTPGAGTPQCSPVEVSRSRRGDYPYAYSGFTLLVHSGGKYFVTPSEDVWNAQTDAVFVLPDDGNIRVQLMRGESYPAKLLEGTAAPARPVFKPPPRPGGRC
jgi:hypothetical protein